MIKKRLFYLEYRFNAYISLCNDNVVNVTFTLFCDKE